jgi:hypothetical protein
MPTLFHSIYPFPSSYDAPSTPSPARPVLKSIAPLPFSLGQTKKKRSKNLLLVQDEWLQRIQLIRTACMVQEMKALRVKALWRKRFGGKCFGVAFNEKGTATIISNESPVPAVSWRH